MGNIVRTSLQWLVAGHVGVGKKVGGYNNGHLPLKQWHLSKKHVLSLANIIMHIHDQIYTKSQCMRPV